MTTVREYHERAMARADELLAARERGHHRLADRLAVEAFELELRAASLAFERDVSAATRVILLRSTANLAREAKRWEEGIDLAVRALVSLPAYRHEVFQIIDNLRTYEHLTLRGVTLVDTDVQLSVAGPEVAPDFARADEITKRVDHFRDLMVRTAMRKIGLPYEATTPRAQQFRAVFTPYLSAGRPASYAVTLRFGIDEQRELGLGDPGDEPASRKRPPSVMRVLDDVIASAQAYADGGPKAVQKLIGDDAYAKNAAGLLRQLSPDLKRVNTVGLTIFRRGHPVPIALPERNAFERSVPGWLSLPVLADALPPREIEVVGRLLEGDATAKSTTAKAAIVQDDERIVRFHYDEAALGDIIAGFWKHRVRAQLRREGARGYSLKEIDDA